MIVRVSCPQCGDLTVAVGEIRVARVQGDGDVFRFCCPRCAADVEKRAVGRVADMLLAAGAQKEELAPLHWDDLAVLRAELDADDWMDRLLLA